MFFYLIESQAAFKISLVKKKWNYFYCFRCWFCDLRNSFCFFTFTGYTEIFIKIRKKVFFFLHRFTQLFCDLILNGFTVFILFSKWITFMDSFPHNISQFLMVFKNIGFNIIFILVLSSLFYSIRLTFFFFKFIWIFY